MTTPPEELLKWLDEGRTQAFSKVPYGKIMIDAWRSAVAEGRKIRQDKGDPAASLSTGAKDFAEHFYKADFSENNEIPFYYGYLVQSKLLAERGAQSLTKGTPLKIAVTTRPTNHRYAAVYKPAISPDWSVIIIDFGFLSVLIGLSVILSRYIGLSNDAKGLAFHFPKSGADAFFAKDKSTRNDIVRFLLPCLNLNQNDAPVPLPLDNIDEQRNVAATIFIRSLIFSVVAHEFGHVIRGHRRLHSTPHEQLHQMEYEADALGLILTANNPWKYFEYFGGGETATVMQLTSIHLQALMLAAIGMIEKAENIARNIGHKIALDNTHPDIGNRLKASEYILGTMPMSASMRSHIQETRQSLVDFTDSMWTVIEEELSRQINSRSPISGTDFTVPDADLRFA
ncbi:hypothetical protein GCM10009092_11380 [Bowmanella denitrificans]|uniref:Peptidase M48 domain-containing protein n=1 Tax=Bowmanella denitrificans TaxID=366582 RepID=A0ABP3GLA4_9ALTE